MLFGLLSDRFGRRRAIITALALAITVIPLWAFAPSIALLYAGRIPDAVYGAGRVGRDSRALVRALARFGARLPAGFAYQCGVLLSSSVVWIEAVFAQRTSYREQPWR